MQNKVIYQSGLSDSSGYIFINSSPSIAEVVEPRKPKLSKKIVRKIGISLASISVLNLAFSFAPIMKEEIAYAIQSPFYEVQNKEETQNLKEWVNDPAPKAEVVSQEVVDTQREADLNGVGSYFSVVIPKINARSNIIANVDPSNEKEYLEALKNGVAHAKGTAMPGEGKLIYLFSHSTNSSWNALRYSAVFYLLGKLEKGDLIIVFFGDQKYEYVVEEKLVTFPQDTTWLKNEGQGEELVLQTCIPPGTSFKRLLVVAKPVKRPK